MLPITMARIYVTRLTEPSEGSRLLWKAIEAAGSQRSVGKRVGVATSTVSVWLRGAEAAHRLAASIASDAPHSAGCLGCPPQTSGLVVGSRCLTVVAALDSSKRTEDQDRCSGMHVRTVNRCALHAREVNGSLARPVSSRMKLSARRSRAVKHPEVKDLGLRSGEQRTSALRLPRADARRGRRRGRYAASSSRTQGRIIQRLTAENAELRRELGR